MHTRKLKLGKHKLGKHLFGVVGLLFLLMTLADKVQAASGEVQFIPTATLQSDNLGGFPAANILDANINSWWVGSGTANEWVGLDIGTAAVVTRYRFMPRADLLGGVSTDTHQYGAVFQGGADSVFTTPATYDTIPASGFPFFSRYQYNERPVTTSSSRYWRMFQASGTYDLAELVLIGTPTAGVSARPVAPVPSPFGGRFPAGSTTVTLTSLTTSASLYYTTNGSTPTTGSTLYTGAFTLTVPTAGLTLKILASDASLSTPGSTVTSAFFSGKAYVPSEDWSDDRGNFIEAHGGGILDNTARDGRYYWYGAHMNRPTSGADTVGNRGVWCYSSTDLLNWRFDGELLDNTATAWKWIERPHVLYNASTGKYVLWAHGASLHDGTDRAVVATSTSPSSGWSWVSTSLNPDGLGYKDCNLFQDTDGTAYTVYTQGDQNAIIVSKLSADYLTAGISRVVAITGGRESPVLFKRGSTYFLINSASNYYNSSATYDPRYMTASSPLGTWSSNALLYSSAAVPVGDPLGSNFNAQPSFFLQVGTNIFFGSDSWGFGNIYSSRQVWLPLSFPSSTTVTPLMYHAWSPSTFTGTYNLMPLTASVDSTGLLLTVTFANATLPLSVPGSLTGFAPTFPVAGSLALPVSSVSVAGATLTATLETQMPYGPASTPRLAVFATSNLTDAAGAGVESFTNPGLVITNNSTVTFGGAFAANTIPPFTFYGSYSDYGGTYKLTTAGTVLSFLVTGTDAQIVLNNGAGTITYANLDGTGATSLTYTNGAGDFLHRLFAGLPDSAHLVSILTTSPTYIRYAGTGELIAVRGAAPAVTQSPTFSVVAPTSGATGHASSAATVRLVPGLKFSAAQTVTMTASDGTLTVTTGGTATGNGTGAVTVTPAVNDTAFTYTYTPATAGAKTITFGNGQSWLNPSSASFLAASLLFRSRSQGGSRPGSRSPL